MLYTMRIQAQFTDQKYPDPLGQPPPNSTDSTSSPRRPNLASIGAEQTPVPRISEHAPPRSSTDRTNPTDQTRIPTNQPLPRGPGQAAAPESSEQKRRGVEQSRTWAPLGIPTRHRRGRDQEGTAARAPPPTDPAWGGSAPRQRGDGVGGGCCSARLGPPVVVDLIFFFSRSLLAVVACPPSSRYLSPPRLRRAVGPTWRRRVFCDRAPGGLGNCVSGLPAGSTRPTSPLR
jgi:hypothetical protein